MPIADAEPCRVLCSIRPNRLLISSLPQTFAAWPVWHDSTRAEVWFMPTSRKAIARIWHKARRWDRETRQPGKHGGTIGRTALATLYVLAFDFLNYRTGRLDPSLDAITAKDRDAEGRFRLRQRTNAYGLLPPTQWKGYLDDDPPEPAAATLGAYSGPGPDNRRRRFARQRRCYGDSDASEADPATDWRSRSPGLGGQRARFNGVHLLPRNPTQIFSIRIVERRISAR